MRNLFRCAGLTLALLLVAGSVVRAQDPTVNVGNVTSGVTSNITFDVGNSGLSQNAGFGQHTDFTLPTGPFTGSTVGSPGTILNGDLFCIDLWHGQNPGAVQNMNISTVAALASFITGTEGVNVDPNLAAKLNYLGYVYETVYQGTSGTARNNASAADQLAIWGLIDTGPHGGFSASGISTSNAATDYSKIQTLLGGTGPQTIEGVTVQAYGAAGTTGYSAEVYLIPSQGAGTNSGGQDFLTWTAVAVPEPSTMAIAGLGALGMIGYGLRRRKSS